MISERSTNIDMYYHVIHPSEYQKQETIPSVRLVSPEISKIPHDDDWIIKLQTTKCD